VSTPPEGSLKGAKAKLGAPNQGVADEPVDSDSGRADCARRAPSTFTRVSLTSGVRPDRQGARAPLRVRCTTDCVAVRVETRTARLSRAGPGQPRLCAGGAAGGVGARDPLPG
jgi:hypothetical protein